VAFLAFYLVRMQRYRSTTGRLQDSLAQVAVQSEEMLEEIGAREAELRGSGLKLETDSYVDLRPAIEALASGRANGLGETLGLATLEREAAEAEGELARLDAALAEVRAAGT